MPAQRPERPAPGHAMLLPRVEQDENTQRAFQAVAPKVQQLQRTIGDLATTVDEVAAGAASGGFVNVVTAFSATGNGTVDDGPAIQAAIDQSPGRMIYFPRGKYLFSTTLKISQRSTYLFGDYGNRFTENGTQLIYTGTGPAIQIGADNGNPWSNGDYDGPQDQRFENLWLSHGAPDTTLASAPGAGNVMKAGAYGIWDWRAGQIVMRNVGLEHFEANFVGINSDIDNFQYIISLYSKYGMYLGPRSDQCSIRDLYTFLCDRSIVIDGARGVRISDSQFVGVGTASSSAIEVRRGSGQVVVSSPWFEHLGGTGYAGTDQLSQVSAGEVDGYGAGGSIQTPGGAPNTAPVKGVSVRDPLVYVSAAALAGHTRFIVSAGKCNGLILDHPQAPPNISLSNLDAYVGIEATQSPSLTDTQIDLRGMESGTPLSKFFSNLGAGTPALFIVCGGTDGGKIYTNAQLSIYVPGAPTGAERLDITSNNLAGQVYINEPTYTGGQTQRLQLTRSQQQGNNAAAPAAGTWERGDRVFNIDPVAAGFIGWVCVTSGTPGTWKAWGAIQP